MPAAAEPTEIKVSVTVLSQMFLYLDALKIDKDAYLRSLGVDPSIVDSPHTHIPIETYLLIQDEAAAYTGDPYFGLHMGEYAHAGSWSILGYVMMNCKTLGEAFQRSSRYARIIGNLIDGKPKIGLKNIELVMFTPPQTPEMSRHCFESTFASTVAMMRSLTGTEISPLQVKFTHSAPEELTEYDRIFKCPVLFDQKHNSLTIDRAILNTPVLYANPELLDYFENYARNFLAEIDRHDEYTRKATEIILSHLDDENLSIKKVAREMSVSVRTLQNRLSDEGVVFSELLTDIRKSLAKKYLREDYSVEQITYLLGYSEPSVFRKAFKKWSGQTPGQFRQESYSAMSSA